MRDIFATLAHLSLTGALLAMAVLGIAIVVFIFGPMILNTALGAEIFPLEKPRKDT